MPAMADRGFFSYTAWKDSAAISAALLWRMRANNVLPVLEDLKDGSFLSAVYSSPKDRRNNKDPITVRVIEYTVTTGEEASEFRLITTLLDPDAAPAQELAEAYARRWEIESCFDEFKTPSAAPKSCCVPKPSDGVLQEIYDICACTTPSDPSSAVSPTSSTRIPCSSRSHGPSVPYGVLSPRARLFPPQRLAETLTVFCREILHELLPPQRSNPRVIKRKMSNWPLKRIPKTPK